MSSFRRDLASSANMTGLALFSKEDLTVITYQLHTLFETDYRIPLAQCGISVTPVGIAPIWKGPLVIKPKEGEFDWVGLNAHEDPLFELGKNYPMPARNREQLIQIAGVVDFRGVVIWHEVPNTKTSQIIDQLPRELVAPISFQDDLAVITNRLLKGSVEVAKFVIPIALVLALGLGVAMLYALAAIAACDTDPVVMGVIPLNGRTDPGTPALFVELTRWDVRVRR